MKIPINKIVLLFVIAIFSLSVSGQWAKVIMDEQISNPASLIPGDIDGDGDLDIAATIFGNTDFVWFENENNTWTRHIVDPNIGGVGVYIADIDGDDTLDLTLAAWGANSVRWYKNNGGSPITWTPYTIDSNLGGAEFVYVADMDSDDDPDVVATGVGANKVVWYENEGGMPVSWTKHIIDSDPGNPIVCLAIDIDGDDTLDVVANGQSYQDVIWYKNEHAGQKWTKNIIDNYLAGANEVDAVDLDGDGDPDVVATGKNANDLVWYENRGGTPVNWEKHTIDADLRGAFALDVADFDANGTLDVAATGNGAGDVVWYANYGGAPLTWKKSFIDEDLPGAWEIRAIDADNNRMPDLVVNQWLSNGSIVCYYNSPAMEAAWEKMNSLNEAKSSVGSCVIDSMIYVFGGGQNLTALNTAVAYNTKSGDWTELEPVPVEVGFTNVGVVDHTIYLTGGWNNPGSWGTINSTYAYDPIENSWESRAPCPKSSGDNASCVLDGKLYVFGGLKDFPDRDATGQKDTYAYDPATDSWDQLADMNHMRGDAATASVYEGMIYVIGGIAADTKSHIVGTPEKYNPAENTWTELSAMPVPVACHVSMVHKDKIYVFGGADSVNFDANPELGRCIDLIQQYDPARDEWSIMQPMPFKRGRMAGQKVDNYVYLIGGFSRDTRDFDSVLDEVWSFNLDSLKEWVVPCSEVTVSPATCSLDKDSTHSLLAKVYPDYANDRTVSWSSDNEQVATVSADGVVKAVSEGEARITVTANGGACIAVCTVTVNPLVGTERNRADHFRLLPNPVREILFVQSGLSESHRVEVASVNGQILFSRTMDVPDYQIDFSSFKNGVYFLTVRSRDNVITRKIIKL